MMAMAMEMAMAMAMAMVMVMVMVMVLVIVIIVPEVLSAALDSAGKVDNWILGRADVLVSSRRMSVRGVTSQPAE
jgi:hypothetical protein